MSASQIKITYHPPSGGGCFVDVVRNFRTPDEEKLIRIAEVTYPLREAFSPPDSLMLQPIPARKHLWWLGPEEDIRVPCAITMDALRYYLKMSQLYGRGRPPNAYPGPRPVSSFTYAADVSHQASFKRDRMVFRDVSVVELRLDWGSGSMGFHLDRTVLLDGSGKVVAVFGDRPASVLLTQAGPAPLGESEPRIGYEA
ncbi:MAG TPA: hypothetical protein VFR25_09100, partial [Candidatus Eisenbacteria bacterium]|nr:hypothetical protein [Candidatus Eisenbacteria bacterium]